MLDNQFKASVFVLSVRTKTARVNTSDLKKKTRQNSVRESMRSALSSLFAHSLRVICLSALLNKWPHVLNDLINLQRIHECDVEGFLHE